MLFRKILPKRFKVNAYLLIDLSEDMIHLPSGKMIPVKNIIKIDTDKGVIIYKDDKGMIHEEPYLPLKEIAKKLSSELHQTAYAYA